MESIGSIEVDPRGRWVAYDYVPRYDSLGDFGVSEMRFNGRVAVVLLSEEASVSRELSLGEGTWLGTSSPDGNFLSIFWRSGYSVRVGIYDFADDRLVALPIYPILDFYQSNGVWVSNTDIIFQTVSVEQSSVLVAYRPIAAGMVAEGWKISWQGEHRSIQVLPSLKHGNHYLQRDGTLTRVHAPTGEARSIASGKFVSISPSPDGSWLAAVKQGNLSPQVSPVSNPLSQLYTFDPVLFDLTSTLPPIPLCDSCQAAGTNAFQWAADGADVQFFSRQLNQEWSEGVFQKYSISQQTLTAYPHYGLDLAPPEFDWQSPPPAYPVADSVFVRAHVRSDGKNTPAYSRNVSSKSSNLFAVRADGSISRVDLSGTEAPRIVEFSAVCGLIASTGDAVWRISADSYERLDRSDRCAGARPFRVSATNSLGGKTIEYKSDVQRTLSFNLDLPNAIVSAQAEEAPIAVIMSVSHRGTTLLIVDHKGRRLFSSVINEHLKEIDPAKEQLVRHVYKGRLLTSCLHVPSNWQRGHLIPVVLSVYPTFSDSARCVSHWRYGTIDPFDPELVSAAGVGVLHLAAPRDLLREGKNPLAHFGEIAVGATEELLRQGITNSNSLGLYGVSQGGFSALTIASHSDIFGAVVAINTATNFASHYGQLSIARRALPNDIFSVGNAIKYERGETVQIGELPWESPNDYLESSPLFAVDSMHVPLLLVHSDLDTNFPIQQADEYFTALVRLGRDVEFVVYLGEEHGIASPANVRDLWERIHCWYAMHLPLPHRVCQNPESASAMHLQDE